MLASLHMAHWFTRIPSEAHFQKVNPAVSLFSFESVIGVSFCKLQRFEGMSCVNIGDNGAVRLSSYLILIENSDGTLVLRGRLTRWIECDILISQAYFTSLLVMQCHDEGLGKCLAHRCMVATPPPSAAASEAAQSEHAYWVRAAVAHLNIPLLTGSRDHNLHGEAMNLTASESYIGR